MKFKDPNAFAKDDYINIHINNYKFILNVLKWNKSLTKDIVELIKVYLASTNIILHLVSKAIANKTIVEKTITLNKELYLSLKEDSTKKTYDYFNKHLNELNNYYFNITKSNKIVTALNAFINKNESWSSLFNNLNPLMTKVIKGFDPNHAAKEYFKDIENNLVKEYFLTIRSIPISKLTNQDNIIYLKAFGQALSKNTSINSLSINLTDIEKDEIPILINILKDNIRFNKLHLFYKIKTFGFNDSAPYIDVLKELQNIPNVTGYDSNILFSEQTSFTIWEALKETINKWPKIEVLNLDCYDSESFFEGSLASDLLDTLEKKPTLKEVSLCFRYLLPNSLENLSQKLQYNSIPIKSLDLDSANLNSVFLALENNHTLKNLILYDKLLVSDALVLANSLKVNKTLFNLSLLDIETDVAAFISLADALPQSKITSLDLFHSHDIDYYKGIKAIIKALKENAPLFKLEIENHIIVQKNFARLIEALECNKYTNTLILDPSYDSSLNIEDYTLFAKFLETNTTLIDLTMGSIEHNEQVEVIIKALEKNNHLKELTFKNSQISDKIFTYIASLIEKNNFLTSICLIDEMSDDFKYENIENLITLREVLKTNTLPVIALNNYNHVTDQDTLDIIREIDDLSKRNQDIMHATRQVLNRVKEVIYNVNLAERSHEMDKINNNILRKVTLKDISLIFENKYHVKAILDYAQADAKLKTFQYGPQAHLLTSQHNLNDEAIFHRDCEKYAIENYFRLKGVCKEKLRQNNDDSNHIFDLPKDVMNYILQFVTSNLKEDLKLTQTRFKELLQNNISANNNKIQKFEQNLYKRIIDIDENNEQPHVKIRKIDNNIQEDNFILETATFHDPMELGGDNLEEL
ncbi:MAG: hypothetical protein K0R02_1088 [Rickettsiaceae bacterium]|jgi:hypothetical protein|nr:hypothetical protein [Rickettsiaceae bacterium]